jgi:hypothetical protein
MKSPAAAFASLLLACTTLWPAADPDLGAWSLREVHPPDGPDVPGLVLIIAATASDGRKLTFKGRLADGTEVVLMTIETARDGRDAPLLVDEKSCGQSWAVQLIDDQHASAVLKTNGVPYGSWKASITPDGETLQMEYDIAVAVRNPMTGKSRSGKFLEIWEKSHALGWGNEKHLAEHGATWPAGM